MSETTKGKQPDQIIKTSEVEAQGGILEVGDSIRRMEIVNEAKEKGNLVHDGDASSKFQKILKRLSGRITP